MLDSEPERRESEFETQVAKGMDLDLPDQPEDADQGLLPLDSLSELFLMATEDRYHAAEQSTIRLSEAAHERALQGLQNLNDMPHEVTCRCDQPRAWIVAWSLRSHALCA